MKTMVDAQILQLLSSGSSQNQEKGFRLLYRQYFGLIEQLVLSNNGKKEDAADLFQDTLIVFYNNIKKGHFKAQSTIKTYLFSISRNLWLMKLRRQKLELKFKSQQTTIDIEEDHFNVLAKNETKQLIKELLNELGKECQKILDLFYFRKLKMTEIQKELNLISEQVAKNRKSRCMKKIRSKVRESTRYEALRT